ncbi:MAG: hypothetical protein F2725_03705, partial [Actinobacteria bacterium]|nr:hypothetical protein [Actinomycetota bacterium]
MRMNPQKGLAIVISLSVGFTMLSVKAGISAVKTGTTCSKAGQITLLSGK